jgi:hypothetical protein
MSLAVAAYRFESAWQAQNDRFDKVVILQAEIEIRHHLVCEKSNVLPLDYCHDVSQALIYQPQE